MATLTARGPRGGPDPRIGPDPITDALASVTARLRLARWTRHASRGALAGIGLALALVALAHFDLLPSWLPLEVSLPAVIGLGLGIGTLTAFLRPIPAMDAARLAEGKLGLKERLSSALEFERSPRAGLAPDAALLLRLQSEDAASHARRLDAAQAVPWRWPWEAKAALGGLVLLALALVLPNLPAFVPPQLRVERQIVQKTGDKLQKAAATIAKQADAQHLEGTRKIAAKMQTLGHKLSTGRLDKKQAMVQMSKLTQQMRQEQQKAAAGTLGAGDKSLAEAGQQLSQSLAAGAKGASGQPGPKPGDAGHGFNAPTGGGKNGSPSPAHAPPPQVTPEVQKAAQAMRQNDTQALSEQLRQMADKAGAGKLSPAEQQQAAQDLQKLAGALKDTPMPETQKHVQAASEALKRGDKQGAADEMRKAAQAAEREARQQADQQAMRNAQEAAQGAQSQMAGANSPGDIKDDAGQPGDGQGKGQGQGKEQGKGQGAGQGSGLGSGIGAKQTAQGKHGGGKGNGGSGGGGKGGGKPGDTGGGSSPLKHLGHAAPANGAKAAKLYFGKALNAGPSKTGPTRKVGSGPNGGGGAAPSSVPYYDYVAPAKKSAETTMDKEDIPPAYRSDVRKYFQSLDPPKTGGGKP